MLPSLGVNPDFSNLWQIAETRIWTGVPTPGQDPFNIWHIMFFAWFANLAMHIGLSDMAVFRYAKNWKYGLVFGVRNVPRTHAGLDLLGRYGRGNQS